MSLLLCVVKEFFFILVKLWKCVLVYSFVHMSYGGTHNMYGYLEQYFLYIPITVGMDILEEVLGVTISFSQNILR